MIMSSVQAIDRFTPAFCNRGSDCKADPVDAFCSGCGADIAGYLEAMTASHSAVRIDDHEQINNSVDSPIPPITQLSAVAPRAAVAPADAPPADGAPSQGHMILRDRLIVATFAGSALLGAGGALLVNLA
jgi:hypothetical protein